MQRNTIIALCIVLSLVGLILCFIIKLSFYSRKDMGKDMGKDTGKDTDKGTGKGTGKGTVNETFVQDTTQGQTSQYAEYGMEKCRVLDVSPLDVDAEEYLMVQEFIQSNRIKEWKPVDVDGSGMNSNMDYCYIYNDEQNDMQDFIMANSNCDLNNPIFANNPLINKVFTSQTPDKTHFQSIQKCVLELDPSKRTKKTLGKFFGTLNDTYCSQMASELTNDLRGIQTEYIELLGKNSKLKYDMQILGKKYARDLTDESNCYIKRNTLSNDLYNVTNSNIATITGIQFMNGQLDKCIKDSGVLWETSSNTINNIKIGITSYGNKYQNELSNLKNCQKNLNSSKNAQNANDTNSIIMMENILNMTIANSNLDVNIKSCLFNLSNVTESAKNYQELYNNCFPNINEYNVCSSNLGYCSSNYSICQIDEVKYQKMFEKYENEYMLCFPNLQESRENVNFCMGSNQALITINESEVLRIKEQEPIIKDYQIKYTDCVTNLAPRKEFFTELSRRNIELTNKISELQKLCYQNSQDAANKVINTMESGFDKGTDGALTMTPNACSLGGYAQQPSASNTLNLHLNYP